MYVNVFIYLCCPKKLAPNQNHVLHIQQHLPYISVDVLLPFVHACIGCWLHDFHHCPSDLCSVLLFQ